MLDADVIVLGAGEAGALVASTAVDDGRRVALAYLSLWGSTCLNHGCVPSKFLIHRARVAATARDGDRFRVTTGDVRVDLDGIVDDKVAMLDAHREQSWTAAKGADSLTMLEGRAEFLSSREVRVGGEIVHADRIFIATGMRPSVPSIPGLEEGPWFTNETVMDLRDVPGHLLVLGGGYVGCELGQAFRRFGAEVTLIQRPVRLLPREEPDASAVLERAFTAEGIRVLTRHEVLAIRWEGDRPILEARSSDGSSVEIEGTHLLVATGRTPNTAGLALERAGVESDGRGFVRVDDRLRTTAPRIWAVGDVNGLQPFTRVCQEEAKLAYADAFSDDHTAMRRDALAHAIFTDPEVGSVGLTERAARERGDDVVAGLVPVDRFEKAELMGETRGFVKFVADAASHRLLGCHVVGPFGADLVYGAAIVMRSGGRLDDLAMAVGVFPTLQEGIEGTARAVLRKVAPEEVSGPLVTASHKGGG